MGFYIYIFMVIERWYVIDMDFIFFFNKIDIEIFMKKLDIMEFNFLIIICNIFFNL